MPFQVEYKTTFIESPVPSIEEYLSTLGPEILVNYPDVAGKTPLEVYHDGAAAQPIQRGERANFISETISSSPDGLVVTLTHLWENQDAWLAANPVIPRANANTSISGNITSNANVILPATAYGYVRYLYNEAYISNVQVIMSNVDPIVANV